MKASKTNKPSKIPRKLEAALALPPEKQRQWHGDKPTTCQHCQRKLTTSFFDTSIGGRWGIFCPTCRRDYAPKKIGQGYMLDPSTGRWIKVEG